MNDALPFAGRGLVVTGASRGVGRATAIRLAELGADVALLQRTAAPETIDEIERLGRRAIPVIVDLTDPQAAGNAVREAAEVLGRIDGVVCNAGMIQRKPALEISLEEWDATIALNLTGVFAVSQAAARAFVEQSVRGAIVNVASVLAFQGGINVCGYAASKGAVIQLTRALANEWGALGIRVNAVAPGYVENETTAPLRLDENREREITARIPLGRWAAEREVADAIVYLLDPSASSYVQGHTLAVDGGWLGR